MSLTPEQLKSKFKREGRTFKAFAEAKGYPYHEVVRVVNGVNKATRGRGHEIAVALGLKGTA